MLRLAYASLIVLALVGCGARTGLEAAPAPGDGGRPDAGRPDAALPDAGPPVMPCGDAVPAGSIRWRVEDVVVGAAFGPRGHVYATVRAADGAIDLASFDRCTGALRWRRPAMPAPERPGLVRSPRVRFTSADEVLVVSSNGYIRSYGLWRFDLEGAPLPEYALPQPMVDFYAIPADHGPVVRTYGDEVGYTHALDLAGAVEATWPESITPAEECVASGDRMHCYAGSYRLPSGEVLRESPGSAELVDGTFRHVVPPAVHGDRLYAIVYGVSTYWFDAVDVTDGSRVFRVSLMRTSRGQTDLRLGRPVVGPDGVVYVYANGHREAERYTGALVAFDRDGAERWRFVADATEQEFFFHATHAIGDAGVVYLAIGDGVYAVDARDGRERWALHPGAAFNRPQVAIGPTGDLAVHTDTDELLIIATESSGLADSPWPAPAGDRRNANAL